LAEVSSSEKVLTAAIISRMPRSGSWMIGSIV
jgi:hypothetical protein